VACILVVDDDGDTRESLSELLSEWGVRVRSAANGFEAIAALSYETPALILIDTWMPSMDGAHFLDWLEQRHDLDEVPVVITSGDDSPGAHRRSCAVLQKPYDLDRLLQLVGRYCKPSARGAVRPA